jgi:hypothetical protein
MLANAHNLSHPQPTERSFGIKVGLRRGDPFTLLVGKDWERLHWYATAAERDAAYADMVRRHEYSRSGDEPQIRLEKIDK